MIGYISGNIAYSNNQLSIIKLENGLGYEVRTPTTYKAGQSLELFIYHSISENDQTLWGFKSPQDRELFKLLLTVNKVGPSKAYPLIMTLGVQALINGIIFEDTSVLIKSPGIGKKMAEQIILSLKDKIKDFAIDNGQLHLDSAAIGAMSSKHDAIDLGDKVIVETTQALESLGYKDKDVLPLINKHFDKSISKSEDLIKLVLKEL